MTIAALVLFAVAALGGAFLAIRRFQGQSLPMGVALLHGALAAAGLVVLIAAAATKVLPGPGSVALALFVIAALGGFVLFSFHLRKRQHPAALVLIHGGIAVIAFLVLLVAVVHAAP